MITCTKDRSKLIFNNTETNKTATFDLADQACYSSTGRKVKNLNSFFAHWKLSDIDWLDPDYRKFVNCVAKGNRRIRNVGTMLSELYKYQNNEGYILLGLPTFGRMAYPVSHFSSTVREYLLANFKGIPNHVAQYWYSYFVDQNDSKMGIIQLINKLDLVDGFKELTPRSLDTINDLIKDYNMESKSLLIQLNNYVRREGLTPNEAIDSLRDYNRMSKAMTTKYHKYPKYLLSTHRIIVKNYNAFQEFYEENAFMQAVNMKLAHTGTTYSILVATKSDDVKQEGANLHHCVASYVKTIIAGKTQIVFMRLNKKLDESLLTIEINANKVVQVKGMYNRQPTANELAFIKVYARNKQLTVSENL